MTGTTQTLERRLVWIRSCAANMEIAVETGRTSAASLSLGLWWWQQGRCLGSLCDDGKSCRTVAPIASAAATVALSWCSKTVQSWLQSGTYPAMHPGKRWHCFIFHRGIFPAETILWCAGYWIGSIQTPPCLCSWDRHWKLEMLLSACLLLTWAYNVPTIASKKKN